MPRISRWFIAHLLGCAIAILFAWNAAWIIHYWPTITSTTQEVYQCVVGLR